MYPWVVIASAAKRSRAAERPFGRATVLSGAVTTSSRPRQHGAVLAAVKTAARRLRRWPAARLDRGGARRHAELRSGRRNGPSAAYPAASLLTESRPQRTHMHVQPILRDVDPDIDILFDAIILSLSGDCGREPRQLFGREMKAAPQPCSTRGKTALIASGRDAAVARTLASPLRPALWTIRKDKIASSLRSSQ